jgi:hypothetical protein
MSFVCEEGKLRFTFDDGWKILKWDDHGAYHDCVTGPRVQGGSAAVAARRAWRGCPPAADSGGRAGSAAAT